MLDRITAENSVLPVLIIFVGTLLIVHHTMRKKKSLPPGPRGLPILGAITEMKSKYMYDDFKRLRKLYGDVFTLKIGPRTNIVINGYEIMKELIVKQADSLSERPYSLFAHIVSKEHGIAAASGELWKEQRSFALKTLRDFGFGKRSLETRVMEEVLVFIDEIAKHDKAPFDIQKLISVSVSNVICSIAFGERFDHDDKRFVYLLGKINGIVSRGVILNLFSNSMMWLRYLPGDITGIKAIQNYINEIDEFMKEEIQRHKETFDEDNIRDYIDAFLAAQAQKGSSGDSFYTDLQLEKTMLNFFGAGSETTATTIRWAILFLIRHQDIQKKMYAEIKEIIGESTPSLEHKPNMPYCEAVIAEVQRLGNTLPLGVPHGVKYDVEWKDYVIPKGAMVMTNLTSICMDPETFPEPEKFKPERFLEAEGKCCGQTKFFPFGLGRRVCLGESLARMELFLFIVSIVQRFDLQPETEGVPPNLECIFGVTRSPKPFNLRALPRQ